MANQKLTHTIEWEQIGGNYRIIKLTGSKRQPTLDEAREYLREHHLPEEIWCCGFYNNQELSSLEMTMETEECSKTLVVYFENKKICISIIDEISNKIYYYDSGEGDDSIEIPGNIYPRHMITENVDILRDIMGDFMQKCRPSKRVQWIME